MRISVNISHSTLKAHLPMLLDSAIIFLSKQITFRHAPFWQRACQAFTLAWHFNHTCLSVSPFPVIIKALTLSRLFFSFLMPSPSIFTDMPLALVLHTNQRVLTMFLLVAWLASLLCHWAAHISSGILKVWPRHSCYGFPCFNSFWFSNFLALP